MSPPSWSKLLGNLLNRISVKTELWYISQANLPPCCLWFIHAHLWGLTIWSVNPSSPHCPMFYRDFIRVHQMPWCDSDSPSYVSWIQKPQHLESENKDSLAGFVLCEPRLIPCDQRIIFGIITHLPFTEPVVTSISEPSSLVFFRTYITFTFCKTGMTCTCLYSFFTSPYTIPNVLIPQ